MDNLQGKWTSLAALRPRKDVPTAVGIQSDIERMLTVAIN